MAQTVRTLLVDDIGGGAAEDTVRSGLDGTGYAIDLSAAHAAELRGALARFTAAGRKAPGAGSRRAARAGRETAGGGIDTTEAREWARSQGTGIKDRGRVPAAIIARYREATGK